MMYAAFVEIMMSPAEAASINYPSCLEDLLINLWNGIINVVIEAATTHIVRMSMINKANVVCAWTCHIIVRVVVNG